MKFVVHRLRYYCAAYCLIGMTLCHGAEPQLAEFAASIQLSVTPQRPIIELPLPDSVYTKVTHWDLADLRVFDAQGAAVRHAFCPASEPQPEPTWFTAGAPHADKDANALLYESNHRVPVGYLRLLPSGENSRLHVLIQSRAEANTPWLTQWSGETYSIRTSTEQRSTAPIKIPPTSSPYWRLVFPDDAAPPASAPKFDLGYLPLRLRFLAQGTAPYTLAYGSNRNIAPSATSCEELLAAAGSVDKQQMLGTAILGEVKTSVSDSALSAGQALPMRKLVLWVALLAGIVVIVAVSLSLLKHNRRRNE